MAKEWPDSSSYRLYASAATLYAAFTSHALAYNTSISRVLRHPGMKNRQEHRPSIKPFVLRGSFIPLSLKARQEHRMLRSASDAYPALTRCIRQIPFEGNAHEP